MSGEVKVDRELGKSRTHLTPPTPRSSSMSIHLQDQYRRIRRFLDHQPKRWETFRMFLSVHFKAVLISRSTPLKSELRLLVSASSASLHDACSYRILSYIVDLVLLCIPYPPYS
jgi:hypothetical protein